MCPQIFARLPSGTGLIATSMYPLVPRLRVIPRVPIRAFHSPFVALSASPRLTNPSSSAAPAPMYEKQDDSSSEPHLSSSGTRTYVVSEPDPSDNPYEVPSGAYPNSTSYVSHGPTTTANPGPGSSLLHPHTFGDNAAARSTQGLGEMSRGGNRGGVGFRDTTSTKPGKL